MDWAQGQGPRSLSFAGFSFLESLRHASQQNGNLQGRGNRSQAGSHGRGRRGSWDAQGQDRRKYERLS